jgi:hypothetical protein
MNLEARMRKVTLALSIMVVVLFMAGCGSQSSTTPTTNNPSVTGAPVGLTVTDTPPNGVTVLFFQLSITGATLTSQSGASVPLLSSTNPILINVAQLQTAMAFLGSTNVAEGTYNSLSVTFANPKLTIFNASDTGISSTCAVGTVCVLTASTSGPLTLTFSSSPFPVTLSASSPLAFKLDIHLDTVIQSDLSVNLGATNGVTISEVSPPSSGAPIPGLGKLIGAVQSVGNNQFTIQSFDERTFTINVNSSTTYSNFPSSATCSVSAETFGCLATGQVVNVKVTLQSDGTLLASEVDYVQSSTQQSVEGNIVGLSTSDGNTIMDLIVQLNPSSSLSATLAMGYHISVIVPSSGVTYAINWNGFTFIAPSGVTLSFAAASDLQVGQEVQVVVEGTVNTAGGSGGSIGLTPVGPSAVSFTTNSITLEPSQITGTVAGVNASSMSFTLTTMPALFVSPSATPGSAPPWAPVNVTVLTNGSTTLTNFSSLSGLAIGNVVSVDGWVFSTPKGATPTTVVADQVVLRQGPTPLF